MFFGRSKDHLFYQILIDASSNLVEASKLFRKNVENLKEKEKYAERLKELEHRGDELTHQLIQELNHTFVTPLDREDLFELAVILDDVLDGVEACAARFVYFHFDQTTPSLIQFADIHEKCAKLLHESFVALEKKDFKRIREISIEINELENDADNLMRKSLYELFKEPGDPIELFKIKEIYEKLEKVTDAYESLMNIMEGVVMKYA